MILQHVYLVVQMDTSKQLTHVFLSAVNAPLTAHLVLNPETPMCTLALSVQLTMLLKTLIPLYTAFQQIQSIMDLDLSVQMGVWCALTPTSVKNAQTHLTWLMEPAFSNAMQPIAIIVSLAIPMYALHVKMDSYYQTDNANTLPAEASSVKLVIRRVGFVSNAWLVMKYSHRSLTNKD